MSTLKQRRLLARLTNWLYSDYSHCHRCDLNWRLARSHSTFYLRDETGGHGVFALCQSCWQDCTIDERLPYYRQLWMEQRAFLWRKSELEAHDEEWQLIEKAVKEGK